MTTFSTHTRSHPKFWDYFFLGKASYMAQASKDPSTQVGAVIVNPSRHVLGEGYNGFARGVGDDLSRYQNRDIKLAMTVHAEVNAIILSKRDLAGCTLYTYPFQPCARCAAIVIQAGIVRCVAPPLPEHLRERWESDTLIAREQFLEAGVTMDFLSLGGDAP